MVRLCSVIRVLSFLSVVSDLVIAAFDLIYCSLSGLGIVFVLEIR